jgi:hypothetical protein
VTTPADLDRLTGCTWGKVPNGYACSHMALADHVVSGFDMFSGIWKSTHAIRIRDEKPWKSPAWDQPQQSGAFLEKGDRKPFGPAAIPEKLGAAIVDGHHVGGG